MFHDNHFGRGAEWRTGVEVAVVFGEGAGRDFEADAMTGFEDLRGGSAINMDAIRTSTVTPIRAPVFKLRSLAQQLM